MRLEQSDRCVGSQLSAGLSAVVLKAEDEDRLYKLVDSSCSDSPARNVSAKQPTSHQLTSQHTERHARDANVQDAYTDSQHRYADGRCTRSGLQVAVSRYGVQPSGRSFINARTILR